MAQLPLLTLLRLHHVAKYLSFLAVRHYLLFLRKNILHSLSFFVPLRFARGSPLQIARRLIMVGIRGPTLALKSVLCETMVKTWAKYFVTT